MRSRLVFFLIIFIFSLSPGRAGAEARNLYVGDLIELKITTREFTEEVLREKFNDFEIIELEEKSDGWLLTLRTFEIGEKVIVLGDKEIIISVKSTLDEMDRTTPFEGDLSPQKAGFSVGWWVVAAIIALLFLFSGTLPLIRYLRKRKTALLTPWQKLIRNVDNIPFSDKDAFVQLTFCLKEYLEETYSIQIRGKTTSEIIKELSCVPALRVNLPDIQAWLTASDHVKFSGSAVSDDKKQELYIELKELVGRIEGLKMEGFKEGKT